MKTQTDTLDSYVLLNNSFKKKMVFNIGVEAGFYSEYNNMILCMLYCLENKISFSLYSSNANFKISRGWSDYFLPFCKEESNRYHARYNLRRPNNRQGTGLTNKIKNALDPFREKLVRIVYFKSTQQSDYFTHNLWDKFHNYNFQTKKFNIPELGIDGGIRHACSVLIGLTLRFNPTTTDRIAAIISSMQLPAEYIGLHIRRGDKILEFEYNDVKDYMSKSEKLSDLRVAFVLTDDYGIIEELRNEYPEWKIYTLCQEKERGYDHKLFQQEGLEQKNVKQINLFASIEMLSNASLFIGTYGSNPGMFMGMRLPENKCYSVDFDKWRII